MICFSGILLLYHGYDVVYSQTRPRNFSPDALPETSFSCQDKVRS